MTKTLKQKVDSSDVIGFLKNLKEDEIKEGINYSDSRVKGKGKEGFYAEQQKTQNVIKYIKENYPISIGEHETKTNKKYIHKHKIKLSDKNKSKLEIEFRD